jgi:hypothetical protein
VAFLHRQQALHLRAAIWRAVNVGDAGIRSAAVLDCALLEALAPEPCEGLVRRILIVGFCNYTKSSLL